VHSTPHDKTITRLYTVESIYLDVGHVSTGARWLSVAGSCQSHVSITAITQSNGIDPASAASIAPNTLSVMSTWLVKRLTARRPRSRTNRRGSLKFVAMCFTQHACCGHTFHTKTFHELFHHQTYSHISSHKEIVL